MDKPQAQQIKMSASMAKRVFKLPSGKNVFLNFFNGFVSSHQDIIGIDAGSSYLKILLLRKRNKKYVIRKCLARAFPQAIKDNHSEKKKFCEEALKEFIAEIRSKSPLGRFALSGKGIFIFSLSVPNLTKKDLHGAVRIELKKRLPSQLDINNTIFDYYVTGQLREENNSGLQVTCVAADRQVVEEHVWFLKDLNISPSAINTIPGCLGNLLPYCFDNLAEGKTTALMDIGANVSLLNFYKGRNLVFSREIPIGGEQLTLAMAKSLNLSTGPVVISPEDAEELKRSIGIPLQDEADAEFVSDFGPLKGSQIFALLRPVLEKLVTEANRTISYYVKVFKPENMITELYLTGGTSRLRNIEKFLTFNLEGVKKVESLNIHKIIDGWVDTGVLKQELMLEQAIPHLAAAFGLCIGTGAKVNLLPVNEKLEQKTVLLSTAVRIGLPLIFILALIFYGVNYVNALKYKILVKNIESEIERLEPVAAEVREYIAIKGEFERKKQILASAKGKQPYWWGVFKELSRITPKGVILGKVEAVSGKTPQELRIFGRIFAKYNLVDLELSQYILVLSDSPYFSHVELISSKNDMYSAAPAADFEISCTMKY